MEYRYDVDWIQIKVPDNPNERISVKLKILYLFLLKQLHVQLLILKLLVDIGPLSFYYLGISHIDSKFKIFSECLFLFEFKRLRISILAKLVTWLTKTHQHGTCLKKEFLVTFYPTLDFLYTLELPKTLRQRIRQSQNNDFLEIYLEQCLETSCGSFNNFVVVPKSNLY